MHYLFDLDGTLTDSKSGLALSFNEAFSELGFPDSANEKIDNFLGMPLPEVFAHIQPEISQSEIHRGIEAFRQAYEREGIYANVLYPGVLEMLENIASLGHECSVVTSKPQMYADQVVDELSIRRLVDRVIGANLEETDTKTILVKLALSTSAHAKERTIMLGDRDMDIIGASENGVTAVGALWGYGTEQEMRDAGCTRFVVTASEFTSQFVLAPSPYRAIGRIRARSRARRNRGST